MSSSAKSREVFDGRNGTKIAQEVSMKYKQMFIYHVLSSDDPNKKKAIELQKEESDWIFGVFTSPNISVKINECFAKIYHEQVKDGPMR
jgi:hypothetical protein